MDNDSTDRLKFDKRLRGRRGWVDPEELAREIASLPDGADKIQVVSDAADGDAPPEGGTRRA